MSAESLQKHDYIHNKRSLSCWQRVVITLSLKRLLRGWIGADDFIHKIGWIIHDNKQLIWQRN